MLVLTILFIPESTFAMSMLMLFYGGFLFFYFRTHPLKQDIEVLKSGIQLTNKKERIVIKWSDIKEINFQSRDGVMRLRAIQIIRNSGTKAILIHYPLYKNSIRISQVIKKGLDSFNRQEDFDLNSFTPLSLERIQRNETRFEEFSFISRMPIFSLRTYFPIIGFALIYIFLLATNDQARGVSVIVLLGLLITSLAFIAMAKVGVSENYLRVENYYFPWGKTFRLNEIKEIIIERPRTKSPINIRIILIDDNSKSFPVDNFLQKDWRKLESVLEKKGLKIINTTR